LSALIDNDNLTEIKLSSPPAAQKISHASLTIAAETVNLGIVGNFVRRNAVAFGFSEDEAKSLELAVDEVVSNAIIHGYQSCPNGRVTVETVHIPEGIMVVVKEWGRSFNPLQAPHPDFQSPLGSRRVGGLGLFIVRKIIDEVFFEELPDKTKIFTLIKKFH